MYCITEPFLQCVCNSFVKQATFGTIPVWQYDLPNAFLLTVLAAAEKEGSRSPVV
jgi:hypothetical protein